MTTLLLVAFVAAFIGFIVSVAALYKIIVAKPQRMHNL